MKRILKHSSWLQFLKLLFILTSSIIFHVLLAKILIIAVFFVGLIIPLTQVIVCSLVTKNIPAAKGHSRKIFFQLMKINLPPLNS
jgi:hypothetical protein